MLLITLTEAQLYSSVPEISQQLIVPITPENEAAKWNSAMIETLFLILLLTNVFFLCFFVYSLIDMLFVLWVHCVLTFFGTVKPLKSSK